MDLFILLCNNSIHLRWGGKMRTSLVYYTPGNIHVLVKRCSTCSSYRINDMRYVYPVICFIVK